MSLCVCLGVYAFAYVFVHLFICRGAVENQKWERVVLLIPVLYYKYISYSEIKQLYFSLKFRPRRNLINWREDEFITLRAHFKSKIFIFCPSHSHTPTLSIVIERRYTSSHDNWIASSAVPLLGKQRDNPNLSGERAKKAWQHAARPAQGLPCRAQRREGLPVWNLQGEKNAKPI